MTIYYILQMYTIHKSETQKTKQQTLQHTYIRVNFPVQFKIAS